jgi:phage replication initiation protein
MKLVLTDSGVRLHPAQVAVADGERVGVDWLNFTVSEDIARRLRFSVEGQKLKSDDGESTEVRRLLPVTDVDLLRFAHEIVCELIGVNLELTILDRRHLGWAQTAQMGEAGLIAAGGNGDTIFVSLSGHGCLLAGSAGMHRIADFLDASATGKITRIDLAFDDLDGQLFPVRDIPALWSAGLFDSASGGSRPKLEKRGDWERGDPNRRGLTAYVGSRQGGQLCRAYEKGRQLGDVESEWVRIEAELHSSCFCLLPQMLRTPTRFFAALKPIFERVVLADTEG